MASWPSDPTEVTRWVAALTSPSTPGVRQESVSGGASTRGAGACRAQPPTPPALTATVDLECPYLR